MKFDLFATFENAAWPVLLVSGSGVILRSNAAALSWFGPLAEGTTTLASSIWAMENRTTAEAFLGRLERTATAVWPIRLRLKEGESREFQVHVCQGAREGQRTVLFQILQGATAGTSPQPPDPAGPEVTAAQAHRPERLLQLARTVALDFNNALTSILGHTSFILGQTEATHPWRSSLIEIQKSAYRAADVAGALATFSRHDKDGTPSTPGNLNELVRRVATPFQASATPPLSWRFVLEPRPFAARFDEAKIQQALTRIVENAVEASPPGGRITLRTSNQEFTEARTDSPALLRPGCYLCVEIEDSGPGIPAETLPRIFEPFFSTKQSAGHKGVGLAWAYGILTTHGGAIGVSNSPGSGASFRVYLPATRRVLAAECPVADDVHGTETILMVDDEDILLTLGETVLSSSGYRVVTASSGVKALELFTASPASFDLVITDLVMPQMTGRELVDKLRAISPDLPIICMSGYVRALPPGDEMNYLQKPFTSDDLLRKVRQILDFHPAPGSASPSPIDANPKDIS